MMTPLEVVLAKLPDARERHGSWLARCPAHDDRKASLSIGEGSDGRVLLKCFANCPTERVVQSMGLEMRALFPAKQTGRRVKTKRKIVALYDYVDEKDNLLFQVVRYHPKGFQQRRPDGRGGWIWKTDGITPVLYRLPSLVAAPSDRTVFVVEGEKDVDRLVSCGLVATTNARGAGAWRESYSATLRGRRIVILPDHDDAGHTHAAMVAQALKGIAASIKVVELPGLSVKEDVSNWLSRGHTVDELNVLVARSDEWDHGLPVIDAGDHDLARVTTAAWEALRASNSPPSLFRFATIPARIEEDDSGAPVIRFLTTDRVRHELARRGQWFKRDRKGEVCPSHPPVAVCKDILATPNPPLPVLTRITQAPILGKDGTFETTPGYHPRTRTVYVPDRGLSLPSVSESPQEQDVTRARSVILDMIAEFPFVSDSDRAGAVALSVLPFVRELIDGPTPLHVIQAPSPGSGKSLLTRCLLYPSVGDACGTMSDVGSDEEWRKQITAMLREGKVASIIDNVTRPVTSAALAHVLTTRAFEDRLLGSNVMVHLPVRCVWAMTANNPVLSDEIMRRIVPIRLDPGIDRPWLRDGFQKPDLLLWVRENRAELVWAALTLARAWIGAGRPAPKTKPLGSFEDWTTVIGGILEVAGIPGFLDNLSPFYEATNVEGNAFQEFVFCWWNTYQATEVRTADLLSLALVVEGLDVAGETQRSQCISLGSTLHRHHNRIIGGYRLTLARTAQRAARWRLVPIQGQR